MDVYAILKFLHIAFAIAWAGGGLALVVLAFLAERARDEERVITVVSLSGTFAPLVFGASSALVLIFGLLMVWIGGYTWSDAWIVLGFLGIVVLMAMAKLVFSPLGERFTSLSATPGKQPEALAAARRLMAFAKFDVVILFSIVLLMVAKPGWSDWPVLLVVAAVVALAGLAFLRPERQAAVAA